MGKISDYIKDDIVDTLIIEELKWHLEDNDIVDPPLQNAIHTVIAYFSVPGTYMEGAYDG